MGRSNTISKDLVLKCIEGMPENFSIEELADRLVLFSKIEQGLKDAAEGSMIRHDEILNEIKRKSLH